MRSRLDAALFSVIGKCVLQESYSWKFFLCTKGENGIMERETEPEEKPPVFR